MSPEFAFEEPPVLLIVDDAEVIRELCTQALREFRVLQAVDGISALEIIGREKIDLVLSDVMMPGIDGLELLRLIKKREPNLPVVMMTGFAEKEVILEALKENADDFVIKPINLLQLRTTVRKAFERCRLRSELIELQRMDRLKSEFLGLVSHKLKTPATSVTLFLHNLHDGSIDLQDQGCQQALAEARHELGYLNQLIRDLLFYSEALLQHESFRPIAGSLAEVVAVILPEITLDATDKKQIFELALPNDLPDFAFDPRLIGFVLRALLSNAVKFTPAGGKIRCEVDAPENQIRIRVIDNGPGIPPEELAKVFEKFYQIDPFRCGQVRGFGLGLYYARLFVQRHNGTIQLDSRPGHGTLVTVILPRAR